MDVLGGDPLTPQGFEKAVAPRFTNGTAPTGPLWRQEMALLIVRDPQFARSFVNRMWTQFMGRGIVHPPENFSRKNPPSHPELLEALTKDFVDGGYDVRRLVRAIVRSRPYRLTSARPGATEADDKAFARGIPKPLSAYQYFNALARASGLEKDYAGSPEQWAEDREGKLFKRTDEGKPVADLL